VRDPTAPLTLNQTRVSREAGLGRLLCRLSACYSQPITILRREAHGPPATNLSSKTVYPRDIVARGLGRGLAGGQLDSFGLATAKLLAPVWSVVRRGSPIRIAPTPMPRERIRKN
jgi:hypothetical protein